MSPKGPPLSFLLFCYRMRVYKSKRIPPFTFFGTVRHFPKEFFFENFKFFSKKNVLRFLSLRYSADLRRSRLVDIICEVCCVLLRRKRRIEISALHPNIYSNLTPICGHCLSHVKQ